MSMIWSSAPISDMHVRQIAWEEPLIAPPIDVSASTAVVGQKRVRHTGPANNNVQDNRKRSKGSSISNLTKGSSEMVVEGGMLITGSLLDVSELYRLLPSTQKKFSSVQTRSKGPRKAHTKAVSKERGLKSNLASTRSAMAADEAVSPMPVGGSVSKVRAEAAMDLLSFSTRDAMEALGHRDNHISSSTLARNRAAWARLTCPPAKDTSTAPAILADSAIALQEADDFMLKDLGLSVEEMQALDMIAAQEHLDEGLYKEAFSKFDVDGSGAITPEELRAVMVSLGEVMDDVELEKLIHEADTDGDGEIDYTEFVGLMKARKRLMALASTMAAVRGGGGLKSTSKPASLASSSVVMPLLSLSTLNNNFVDLPPLRMEGTTSITLRPSDKRKRMRVGESDAVDEEDFYYMPRPTPKVLRTGAAANMHELRRELAIAKTNADRLTLLVKEDINVIQNNYPITGLRAQIFCKKWGAEKLGNIFHRIEYAYINAAWSKWKLYLEYLVCQQKAQTYLRFKGSRRLVSLFTNWQRKKYMAVWNTWMDEVGRQRREELESAAVQLQRWLRGSMCKLKYYRLRRQLAAIEIQRVGRGHIARKQFKILKRMKLENDSATKIQNAYRGYVSRRIYRIMRQAKREKDAATEIQRVWRGVLGRRVAARKRLERLRNLSASVIQRAWKCHKARKTAAIYRRAKLETDSATTIQCAWRCHMARKELKRRKRRWAAAINIQRCIRGWLARIRISRMWTSLAGQEKHRARTVAASVIQEWWRYRKGRRVAKSMIVLEHGLLEQEKKRRRAAAIDIQRVSRGYLGRKRVTQMRLRIASAIKIQKVGRGYLGRERVRGIRKAKAHALAREKASVTIQAAWRGKLGRDKARLRRQALEALRAEEAAAATRIAALGRGYLARKKVRRMREEIQTEKENKSLFARRVAAATTIQAVARGRRDRRLVKRMRLRLAEEARENEAAIVVQRNVRKRGAQKKVTKMKQRKNMDKAQRLAEERKERAEAEALAKKEKAAAEAQAKKIRDEEQAKRLKAEELAKKQLAEEQARAATKIQAAARGRRDRKIVETVKKDNAEAARLSLELKMQEEREAMLALEAREKERLALQEVAVMKSEIASASATSSKLLNRQTDAAIRVQSAWRGYRARKAYKLQKEARLAELKVSTRAVADDAVPAEVKAVAEVEAEQAMAALKLQALQRGRATRKKTKALKAEREAEEVKVTEQQEKAGATKIQALYRGKKDRKKSKAMREKRLKEKKEANHKAAAKKVAEADKRQKLAATILIQSLGRGYLARNRVQALRKERDAAKANLDVAALECAALRVQCAWRQHRARKELAKRKAVRQAEILKLKDAEERKRETELLRKQQEKEIAAIRIQSVARGKHGRQVAAEKKRQMRVKDLKSRQKELAAVKIQSRWRGHKQRKIYIKMRRDAAKLKEDAAALMSSTPAIAATPTEADVSEWLQYWSAEYNMNYYFNPRTNETSWTIPGMDAGGYASGSAVDGATDYASNTSVADYSSYYNGYQVCSNCQYEYATRTCTECADGFCENCWGTTHAAAPKSNHNWAAISFDAYGAGTGAEAAATVAEAVWCAECNANAGTKECEQCKDPFCDSCFDATHKKGKKAQHKFKAIGLAALSKCVECEEQIATRACDQCGDAYCDTCYQKGHRKGKKAMHTWQPANGGYSVFDAGAGVNYDDAASAASSYSVEEEWLEYYDSASAKYYYYNAATGETKWA